MWPGGCIRFIRKAEGSVAIISALALLGLVGVASLAVDMGHLYTVRNEMQNTADAAALAAAGNLVVNQGGVAVRDSYAAHQAAMSVAQRQSQLQNLPEVGEEDRNDITVIFGEWNLYAGNPDTAWTEIGTTCGSYSNANAVRVSLQRASGMAYGPVSNLFAAIMGVQTSEVRATATAYLGFANPTPPGSTPPGIVEVPMALPDTALTASRQEGASWWAKLLLPSEAIASGPKIITFKDLGGDTFYQNNLNKPQFAVAKAYLFVVNKADSVPDTVVNNIKKNYTSGTKVRAMDYGSRLYPISEYQWASNIKTIFSTLKSAYNAKKGTYDDQYKYQNPSGKWRVWVPVYKTDNPLTQRLQKGLHYLARLLPLGVSPAQACFKFWDQTYPGGNVPIYVNGFTMVDITGVTYSSNCDDCDPWSPAKDGKRYLNFLDCMVKSSLSCRNANSVTVEVPVDSNTVAPPGVQSGGPDNQHLTPGGGANSGALATIAKLVK